MNYNLTAINSTRHSETRKNQRGLSSGQISKIISYGEVYHAGNNCVAYWMNRRAYCQYDSQSGYDDIPYNTAVIVSYDNKIVTVMHCSHKPGHWKAA